MRFELNLENLNIKAQGYDLVIIAVFMYSLKTF